MIKIFKIKFGKLNLTKSLGRRSIEIYSNKYSKIIRIAISIIKSKDSNENVEQSFARLIRRYITRLKQLISTKISCNNIKNIVNILVIFLVIIKILIVIKYFF